LGFLNINARIRRRYRHLPALPIGTSLLVAKLAQQHILRLQPLPLVMIHWVELAADRDHCRLWCHILPTAKIPSVTNCKVSLFGHLSTGARQAAGALLCPGYLRNGNQKHLMSSNRRSRSKPIYDTRTLTALRDRHDVAG
jgi:hypothetical protein